MDSKEHIAAKRTLSALVDFSNLINASLDINFILNNLLFICFSKFHTARGIIALVKNSNLIVKAAKGLSEKDLIKFPEVNLKNYSSKTEMKRFLEEHKLVINKEIISSKGVRAVLFLGEKMTKKDYDEEDLNFLNTIVNVAATALENSFTMEDLKEANRKLDGKVNQLGALFELSKEFNGVLDINVISKLLVYSIIGQLMVSKYALVTCDNGNMEIIESKFDRELLKNLVLSCDKEKFQGVLKKTEMRKSAPEFYSLGVQLVIPMQIKNETKGLILLGKRINSEDFSQSDIEFISSVGGLAIMAIENSRMFEEMIEKQKIEKDLQLAKNIQKNLLPKKLPDMNNMKIAGYNETARQVGGDYYEALRLDENRVLIGIADVSGKGVQAALIMASLQAYLKSVIKQNLTLDEASNRINDLISENTTDGGFITFFWAIIDEKEMTLTYVNAGHNPPLLIREGSIIKLKKGGMLLGFMKTTVPYVSDTISLNSGDLIVLFTDGITEAMDKKENEFSDERLEKFVLSRGGNEADSVLSEIIEEVNSYTSGTEQSDDITCMVVSVN